MGATHAALKYGILPGAGMSLFNASEMMDRDDNDGYNNIIDSLKGPLLQLLANADLDFDEINEDLIIQTELDYVGYDLSQDRYVNLIEEGIVDPYKVTISALSNAISVAGTIISTGAIVNSNSVAIPD